MALIDKETIRKEIERRLSNIVTGLDFTAEIELNGLLSFLDTLPDEPKRDCSFAVDEDLQNQVDLLEQEVELERELVNYFGNIPDDTDKIDIARHFAEWGAEHAEK